MRALPILAKSCSALRDFAPSGLDVRMKVANRAHAFEQQGEMQDRRLGEPASDKLHVDWQPLPCCCRTASIGRATR